MRGDPVELAMALEEALENGDKRLAELKLYLVEPPAVVSCIKGGFEIDVVIYAKCRNTAFFVSAEAAQFGVGTLNEFGDVVESDHCPNITMALRAFAGAVKEES